MTESKDAWPFPGNSHLKKREIPFLDSGVTKDSTPYFFSVEDKERLPINGVWGWHFHNGKTSYGEDRHINPGKTLKAILKINSFGEYFSPQVCTTGMHASNGIENAIIYGKGPLLSIVYVWGRLSLNINKFCGDYRFCAWTIDFDKFCTKYGIYVIVPSYHFRMKRNLDYISRPNSGGIKTTSLEISPSEVEKLLRNEFILHQINGYSDILP
jgi:hypothetical protein